MSHFSTFSIDKRTAVLPIDPTILPKNSLFLVLFLRYPNLLSIVRYDLSVAHLNPLQIDSFYQIDRLKCDCNFMKEVQNFSHEQLSRLSND